MATPLVAQARTRLTPLGDVRAVLSDLGDQVQAEGYSVYVLTADGRVVTVEGDALPGDVVRIPATAGRGATVDGSFRERAIPFRYVWPSELDLMARIAGMQLRERWSGWEREPFTRESTKHVSVWEKPA